MMPVHVSTTAYEFAHGKKPSGGTDYTSWYFRIGSQEVYFMGKYSEAKKAAIAYARAGGVAQIEVMS